jgi:hypothetical protein
VSPDRQNLQSIGPRTRDSCRSYGVFDPRSVMWRSRPRKPFQQLRSVAERHITGIATNGTYVAPSVLCPPHRTPWLLAEGRALMGT